MHTAGEEHSTIRKQMEEDPVLALCVYGRSFLQTVRSLQTLYVIDSKYLDDPADRLLETIERVERLMARCRSRKTGGND